MDDKKREDFANRMQDTLNAGALNLALGLGYRLGLLEALGRARGPLTAAELADSAGLKARYVREWLGVVVCGRVVELRQGPDGEERFSLPEEHAACLTKAAGNNNLGVYMQEIPLLTGLVLDRVAEGFSTGQGVDYEHYPPFQAFMEELSEAKHRQVLIDRFLPQVDGGRLIKRLEAGSRVCDLGCGHGLAPLLMARAFPNSRFIGLDISEQAIGAARQRAQAEDLPNLEYRTVDAARLSENPDLAGRFDLVTAFDAIHDQTDPAGALTGVRHLLAADGLLAMIDIAAETGIAGNADHPMGAFLYTVSLMHCMPVGLVDHGAGLGMMWGRDKAVAMLTEAGFSRVAVVEMPDDPFNYLYEARK